ncbi:class D sortase [Bacillus subtilis]|uniref:class D sortase n=1 Tax=Bacillus subtilis TaxID=1423 RepID=UPI0022565D1A|nr:class D sortase [Bacillus subtilis]MCX4074707.1 class D sortase [Bacillus subtilis]
MNSKNFFLILIAGGILFAWFGGGEEIITSHQKTVTALAEAQKIVNENVGENKDDSERKIVIKKKFNPEIGDTVGVLTIPKISAELPIVEGTDAEDLKKGVGHYKGSSYPEDNGQIVLSGHRDTVFRRTGELKEGDILTINLSYGQFNYKITHSKIVDAEDTSIITLQKEKEELVLTTCYPFSYVGNAPQRYIIYAAPTQPKS